MARPLPWPPAPAPRRRHHAVGAVPKGPYVDALKVSCAGAVDSGCVTVGNVSTVSGPVPGLFEGA